MRRLLTLLLCLFPALCLAEEKTYVQLMTSAGEIIIELEDAKAPISVENFLNYVDKGHYNGTVFHRIVPDMVIQGGGYVIAQGQLIEKPTDPPIINEGQNGLKNLRGTLAMARKPHPDSATAQFYINVENNSHLDYPSNGGYAVFGKVRKGMDVVDNIRFGKTEVTPASIVAAIELDEAPELPEPEPEPVPIPDTRQFGDSESIICRMVISPWKQALTYVPLLLAFLVGSIPFGLLIAKSQGVDIREHGSGNIGATNVWRTLGKKFGIPCLILDILKGFIPVLLVVNFLQIDGRTVQLALPLPETWILTVDASQATHVQIIHILTALLAVLGHNYSPWVRFKGGKGIATSAGVLIGLIPVGALILLAIWLILFFTTRYVSVASILASCSLPFVVLYGSWHHGRLQDGTWNKPLFAFALIIAVMATIKHRSNIKRLREGTEARFTRKSKSDNE